MIFNYHFVEKNPKKLFCKKKKNKKSELLQIENKCEKKIKKHVGKLCSTKKKAL